MGFPLVDFFRDIFVPGKTITLKQRFAAEQAKININMFAIQSAVSLIAGTIAKCEFKTYVNGEEKQGDEYYLWNFSPNDNQSGDAFIRQLITRLLLHNEALVIENAQGKLVVADSFTRTPYAFVPDVFSGITCGNLMLGRTYTSQEVLYFRLDWHGIQPFLAEVLGSYNDLLDLAYGKYKRLGGRKGLVNIGQTKTGDTETQRQIDNLFNNDFRNFFQAENAVISLPKNVTYTDQPEQVSKQAVNIINDITALVKETFSRAAQAFHIPPAMLSGDIADVGGPTKNYLSFCIDPIISVLQKEIVRKRYNSADFQRGNFLRIDTTRVQHINPFDMAEQIDKLISDGLYSVDELRAKFGEPPLDEPWSKLHWITKNYQHITAADMPDTTAKGGGTDGTQTNQNNLGSENASGNA